MTLEDIGDDLRLWTLHSIGQSTPALQQAQVKAAKRLARIQGQSFPTKAYRALFVDTRKLRSWKDFRLFIVDRGLPESYSKSPKGIQKFLADGGGAANRGMNTHTLVVEVAVPHAEWLFNANDLIRRLPKKQRELAIDFSLNDYVPHEEVVARSGALLRAVKKDLVRLVGYGGRTITWLPKAKLLGASVFS